MINQDRKNRLVDLGAEALADALLKLASRDDAADDVVERMIATPNENIKRYKAKLAGLKRKRRFVGWRESAAFAAELRAMLDDLRSGVEDPRTGVELVASFYENDRAIFEHCVDSSGNIGDVFHFYARDLFVSYASRCEDKPWLGELVLRLNREDDYGVRHTLIDCAVQYLPEPVVRNMISRLQKSAEKETDKYKRHHWLFGVESLARQLKDAPLFEKTRIASWGDPSTAACIDIAQVYLDSGDPKTALAWLERISEDESFKSYERHRLLLDVYGRLGRRDEQAEVAWEIFRSERSAESLEGLLDVIGNKQKDRVISDETALILKDEHLSCYDAEFLIAMGRSDDAEAYIRSRKDQLDGDSYGSLLPLAEAMEADGRRLTATLIYRALLDSILKRGQSRIYRHAVRYLRKLDGLAATVNDWGDIEPHASYVAELRRVHRRKSAFWSQYEK